MHFLLKMNNVYYDASPASYNISTLLYEGVPDDGYNITTLLLTSNLSLSDLFNEVTIGEETFKPIEKFDNFSIVSSDDTTIKINGVKELNNLLIMNKDIYLDESMYEYINSISTISSGIVKFVFSLNKGETWNTIIYGETIKLQNTVILKNYQDMNQLEKNQWTVFADEISLSGIDSSFFNTINYSQYIGKNIRFAILLNVISYSETPNIKNISLNYNEVPHLIKVKRNEIETNLFSNTVQLIPQFDNNYVETRVLTHEYFSNNIGDNRQPLVTPILTLNQTEGIIELQWNNILNADYYKIYINGNAIQTNELNYNYTLDKKGIYSFLVRAFTNNPRYKESLFSNGFIIDNLGYLTTANNEFITVSKNGTTYKFLTKR